MLAQTHTVWSLAGFADDGSGVQRRVSCPQQMVGDALALHVLCVNVAGAFTRFTAQLQASWDGGLSWEDVGSAVSQNALGSSSTSLTAVDAGLWRVEATFTPTVGTAAWIGQVSVNESEL